MVCSVSTDKGESWAEWEPVNPDWPGFLPWVDYDADNTAWMVALDGTRILVSSSPDGLTWSQPIAVGQYKNPESGGEYGWPVLRGSDFRMFAVPSLAVDRTDGPFGGSIYATWFDHSTGYGRTMLTVSRDGGATWTEPIRVRDHSALPDHDQFMPSIGVGPDGTVDLSWYDRRLDPANHLFDLFYSYSLDGGATWSPDLRVSNVSSDEQYSLHQNGMVFMGDYLDIDSSDGMAHVIWVDTRNMKADAFIAHVARPSANDLYAPAV
jgi:hypothetical protein